MEQLESDKPKVEIAYRRGVKPEGNRKALELMEEVFQPDGANWRGIGNIAGSGLKIRQKYHHFDAEKNFPIDLKPGIEPKGCRCGDILRGVVTPPECKLFSNVCTPDKPVGPCMVSSEGACAAYYSYGEGYE